MSMVKKAKVSSLRHQQEAKQQQLCRTIPVQLCTESFSSECRAMYELALATFDNFTFNVYWQDVKTYCFKLKHFNKCFAMLSVSNQKEIMIKTHFCYLIKNNLHVHTTPHMVFLHFSCKQIFSKI